MLAWPPASRVAEPMGVPSERSWTVPVGVPAPGALTVTVAVKVRGSPKVAVRSDEASATAVEAGCTVSGVAPEVPPRKAASPP